MKFFDILHFIERFADVHVTCIGDLMLDRFVYGEVERVSPEAPIPVLHVVSEQMRLGGVGNVVRNVTSLGGRAACLAVTGQDAAGEVIRALFKAEPRAEALLMEDSRRPTTTKTRFVATNQQLLRTDRESREALEQDEEDRLLACMNDVLDRTHVVVLSDYAKGVLSGGLLPAVIEAARRHERPVIVDPKNPRLASYGSATVITPNAKELSAATGLPCSEDEEVSAAAHRALAQCSADAILVTRSARGMTLVRRSQEALHFRSQVREVFDVTGAGDTVVATLALMIGAGADLASAAEVANATAGIVVGKMGTAVVSPDELAAAIENIEGTDARIVSKDRALEQAARWRAKGLRVGFTNGCFDLLHPGHVEVLRRARQACDRLIVGLNSDASANRLKGRLRPVQPDKSRASVLAALRWVDLVIIFEEDTPARLIEAIRPEILVKGADYQADQIVGADFVRSYGGQVIIVPLVEGERSSGMVARILERESLSAATNTQGAHRPPK